MNLVDVVERVDRMPRVLPGYKAQAKARIAEVGLSVISKKGFRRTTMADIAQEVGVSTSDLYLYFSGKVDLLKEIQASAHRETNRWMRDVLHRADILEGLLEGFDLRVAAQEREPMIGSVWLELVVEGFSNPEVAAAMHKEWREDRKTFARFVRQLAKSRPLPRGMSADDAALALVTSFFGAILQLSMGASPAQARRALRASLRALFPS